ncbi:MAG: exodeoxyribonuclease VII small subunit [Dysgonamonadaceae bacterium]|jgi:exodeoxyribonuclease VII small subunit|nr:exodeoxyribonuclease VII small subunit [Dysgonamonadaceae bacterium]
MSKTEISYKEAFRRLQEIQHSIENNTLEVDELTAVLQEAGKLLAICKEKLFAVSEKTKKILEEIK